MNIPITKRVMMGGSRKPCGCCGACQCGKTPAKFNAGLRSAAAEGKLDDNPKFKAAVENSAVKMYNSPARKNCYGKKK